MSRYVVDRVATRAWKLILIFMFAWTGATLAQSLETPYYLDGDVVVFRFNIQDYLQQLSIDKDEKLDFRDMNIQDVAISGTFNNWNKRGWKMNKINETTFELRKPLKAFKDKFPIEFRYILNGEYNNFVPVYRNFKDSFLEEVYSVDFSQFTISPTGKVRFYLAGHQKAEKVVLAGTFNNWNEEKILMNRIDGGWELRGDLPPGRYEYKFIVDGKWTEDPANPDFVKNEHGTLNSVLHVVQKVDFQLKGYPSAKYVMLAGDFTNWGSEPLKMTYDGNAWRISASLTSGKHAYKFIVDGKWIKDPENPIEEDDGHGNVNSILFVH